MMSNFKFCPMCGSKREDGSQFCKNCNFEFLVGNYVKLVDDKSENDVEITVEKVSQEEFLESNDILRQTRDKINCCIAKYLNNELILQYGEKYAETVSFELSEYISINLNSLFSNDFNDSFLEIIESLIHDENFINSKNIFIQWIDENRGHLPGMVLNQYRLPIQMNVDILKKIISLGLVDSDENKKLIELLNEYLDFESEFILNLI